MSGTVNYTYSLAGARFANPVSEEHFGSGFENRGAQTVDPSDDVAQLVERLDLQYLRFPGGSHMEKFFDLANPDERRPIALFGDNAGQPAINDFVSLSEFFAYADANNISPIVAIPTWRYFDQNTRSIDPAAEAVIKGFIRDVLTGEYGNIDIHAFEIGNEWFDDDFNWTPAEFAHVQKSIAVWVAEVRADVQPINRPDIYIQSSQLGSQDSDRNGIKDNVEFLSVFTQAQLAQIDGIVDHFYQPVRSATIFDFPDSLVASTRIGRLREDGWNVTGTNALKIVTTEWNVRADEGKGEITGLERAPMFVRLFSDMISAGVDVASVFTTQALGDSDGTIAQKDEDTFTPTGLLFRMMKNALVGTELVDADGNGNFTTNDVLFQNTAGHNVGYTFTYTSDDKVVVYFSSGVGSTTTINADFGQLLNSGYHLHGTVLKVTANGDPLAKDADGMLEARTRRDLEGATVDGLLDFDLGGYETIQLEFTKNGGVSLAGDDQTATSDEIIGTGFNDHLEGFDSNDTLIGDGGNDTLEGGTDDDSITGGAGSDVIFTGGAASNGYGRDTASGGDGDDQLIGSNGDDWLYGDAGNDTLNGGEDYSTADVDYLYGGDGNDLLISGQGTTRADHQHRGDQLFGEAGDDTLQGGQADDHLEGGVGDDSITGGAGNDVINTGTIGSQTVGDDTASGGDGDDEITGSNASDRLYGDAGNDTLNGGDDWITADVDYLYGGDGNDLLISGQGTTRADHQHRGDQLFGEAGDDTLQGGQADDHLEGGVGDDSITGGAGNDVINTGTIGSQTVGDDTASGGDGDDEITGSNASDRLYGDAGNDTLNGGDDWITADVDYLYGGDGNDLLISGQGTTRADHQHRGDQLFGEAGDDTLQGGQADDHLEGGAGNDSITGGAGNDVINTGTFDSRTAGHDTAAGGDGDDEITGSNASDWLYGDAGNDTLNGGDDWITADVDYLYGGDGNDLLISGQGETQADHQHRGDQLFGGAGNDTLTGGKANDYLEGGTGADSFVFLSDFGQDTIADFSTSQSGETIDLSGVSQITSFSDLATNHLTQSGSDAVINDGAGNTITLTGINMADLTADDFLF
ncbi:calcium-binding protein [Ruegeria pomeroyi]|nr:calcium-binding protein [Ruegeria pomeroyi]